MQLPPHLFRVAPQGPGTNVLFSTFQSQCWFCPVSPPVSFRLPTCLFHLGEQLLLRCDSSTDTQCEPCDERYYNDEYTYSDCKKCATCDKERGLHELEPCKKTSNTVCACLPGHSPAKDTLGESERRCDPCPSGYFSRGGKERCRPWTNCTAYGQKTLRAGKRDEDAICSEPPTRVPRQTAIVVPSSLRQGPGTATTTSSSTLTTSATQPGRDRPKEQRDGLLIIFLTSAGLLLVVGLVIFLLFRQKAKKKDSAVFTNVPHEDGRNSYRFPVQEEQKDCKSSLARI
ncbi:tumor necrosis factor receptor superfamily member 4 isoform X3 [Varanus komodoensis]|uniref:tumor necrosis factor receptor superfamily member 4 isoform X3 n=1 Tax=Varanus komodoensis TaxID=61221 RepID=UPI001CF7C80C|nr:tumor necrosis factor receptor superfamily member 4 isoform X3 [Varanus komodoensis]